MVKTLGDTAVRINQGERLLSQNGHFEFIGKPNGDFCIHQLVGKKQELWHPDGKRWGKAAKHGVKSTFFQAQRTDGNVVAYVMTSGNDNIPWWASGTTYDGSGKNMLKLHNSGLLVAYKDITDTKSGYWCSEVTVDTSFYTQKEQLENELQTIQKVVTTLNNNLTTANQQITKLNGEITKLTNENKSLRQQVTTLNNQMDKIINDSNKLAQNIDLIKLYKESNNKLQNRVELLEQKVQTLTQIMVQKTKNENEMNIFRNKFNSVTNLLTNLVASHISG